MKGHFIIAVALALVCSACAPKPPNWSPNVAPRSEDWHTGKMLIANFDANSDGIVTRSEVEAGLRQNFLQADHNRDGRLDPDEVSEANQRRISFDQSAAMPLIDWNQDGYVDFTEFATGVRSQFQQIDMDGDGQATIAEFRAAPRG